MRVKLSDITHYSKGSQINREDLIDTGEYIYLNGGINPSGRWTASNVDANTITISEGGNSSGYINYITEPFWCGAHCYYLFDGPKNTKYLYYALKSQQERLFAIRSGACMPNIKKADLGKFEFEFDYDEKKQDEVVSVLSSTENIINNRKKELEKLDELIRARFVEMFGHQSHNEKSLPYMTINDVAEIYLGITHTPTYVEDGVMFISAKNTSGDFLDLSDVKYISREEFENAPKGSKPQVNDVLFSRVGSNLGHPVILRENLELCTFVSLGFLRTKGKVTSNYLKHWMRDDFFAKQVSEHVKGGGQPNLNTGWLKEFKIIVPDLEQQKEFDVFCEQTDKSKFQKYNATILSHNIYMYSKPEGGSYANQL